MNNRTSLVALSLMLSLLPACGGEAGPAMKSDAAGAAFALASDPGDARSIIEAKAAGPSADVVVVLFNIVDCIAVVIVVDAGSVARARLEMVHTLEDVNARAIARLSMRSRVPSRPFARDG